AFVEIDRAIEKEQQKIFLTSKMQARLASSIFSGREHDSSQWKLTALKEVCTATQGVQIPKSKQIQFHQDGYLRYLYISDFRHAKSLKYVEDKYPKKLVSSDDLVMSNTGSQGQVFRGVEGVLSNNLFKIGVNKELVNVDYLFEFLKSDVFIEYQDQRTRGTTQPHMGHKNFLSTPIRLPPLSIQNEVVIKLHKSDEVFERFFENTSSKTERLHTLKSAILAQELQPPQSEAA
ncbi:restriction endonuclease subunit S, partial [Pseudomonadales bacterium]|nr:restriction endonuclease subunit S [Pseudomonadales bacterium]